jgi:hypothetical protein
MPVFAGQSIARPRPLCWYLYQNDPSICVRDGDWSLIGHLDPLYASNDTAFGPTQMEYVKTAKLGAMELYDVVKDTHQRTELSAQFPEVRRRLEDAMRAHYAEIVTSVDWFPPGAPAQGG